MPGDGHRRLVSCLLACALAAGACEARRSATPEERTSQAALNASLEQERPGLSLLRLQDFARRHADSSIAADTEQEMQRWRDLLRPAYLRARDLARRGEFDEAQAVLSDLALVPEEPEGRLAREFLAFEFHKLKASRLLVTGDTAGAGQAARALLAQPLGDQEMHAAQQLADVAALAELGARMTRTSAFQSAARTLQVFLHGFYADNGAYPERLSLDLPELSQMRDAGALRAIAAIESYAATTDTFSLIVVGHGGERLRLTQTGLGEVEPGPAVP